MRSRLALAIVLAATAVGASPLDGAEWGRDPRSAHAHIAALPECRGSLAECRDTTATDENPAPREEPTEEPAMRRHDCPGDRVAIHLGDTPVRFNPDGFCDYRLWYRRCVFMRQAGEDATLGPFCPEGVAPVEGGKHVEYLPVNAEWVWTADVPFTAYVILSDPGTNADEPAESWARCKWRYRLIDLMTGLLILREAWHPKCPSG